MLLHHGLAGSRLQLLNNWIFDSEKVDSSEPAFFMRFFGVGMVQNNKICILIKQLDNVGV